MYKGHNRSELYRTYGHSYVSTTLKSLLSHLVEKHSIVKHNITVRQALQAHRIVDHNTLLKSKIAEFSHLIYDDVDLHGSTIDFVKTDKYGVTILIGGNPIIFRYEIEDEQRCWVLGFVWRALTDTQNLWEIPIKQ